LLGFFNFGRWCYLCWLSFYLVQFVIFEFRSLFFVAWFFVCFIRYVFRVFEFDDLWHSFCSFRLRIVVSFFFQFLMFVLFALVVFLLGVGCVCFLQMVRKFDMIKDIDDKKETLKLVIKVQDLWFVQNRDSSRHMKLILLDQKVKKLYCCFIFYLVLFLCFLLFFQVIWFLQW